MKKYEIVNDMFTETRDAYILHRIRALRDIPAHGIKAGDLGGWIASEKNLSQEGDCWIGGDACVYIDAVVADNALVEDNSKIWGDARVVDNAHVHGLCNVGGYAIVCDCARLNGFAMVFDNGVVGDYAMVLDYGAVLGRAAVKGNAAIFGHATVCGNAIVDHDASISGYACIGREAHIASTRDYLVITPIGPQAASVTFYKVSRKEIWASHCGNQAPADTLPHLWGYNDALKRDYLAALKYAKRTLL